MPAENLIPITEALSTLNSLGANLSYQTAWRLATEGRLPAERIDGRWYLRESSLENIAAALTR